MIEYYINSELKNLTETVSFLKGEGFKVGIWSGEMQDWRFQGWLNQMAAGKNYVRKKEGFENFYYTPSKVCEQIDAWVDKKLFLYNN